MKNGRRTGFLIGLIAVTLAALALASCGKAGDASGKAKGGAIVFALTGDVAALDPAQAYDFTTNPVVNEITEGLLRFSPAGEILPNLAEKWESPDPLTYVYTLRKGVKFSDGTAMTADDVVFSLNRTRDPATASPLAWMFGSVADISKLDDSTVKVTLSTPDAQWKYALGTTAGHVISKAYYEARAATFGKPDGGLMGTGPFALKSWKAGSEIVLEKNKNYWDAANGPFIDKATFKIVEEDQTRITGLKTGEVTATVMLPVDLVPVVQGMANVTVQGVEGFGDDCIAFNTKSGPFADVHARKAALYAFNVKAVLDTIVKDTGVATKNQPVGSALWTYGKDTWQAFQDKAEDYAFDLAKAKAEMAKSGHPKGFKARLVTDADSFRFNTAQAFQQNLKEIGIDLEIEKLTNKELTSRQFSGKRDYDAIMGNWGADYPDPAANVTPFYLASNVGDGGSNWAVYTNKKVDSLVSQQATLSDDTKRAELLTQALMLANADAPYIWVDHPKIFFAASKKFGGYTMSPIWYWDSILRTAYLGK
jgi:peptide/nickel transport system substrate-binding protein